MSTLDKKSKDLISEKLKEFFDFPRDGFSAPIPWIDAVGVSRVKDLSNSHASLYKIGIPEEELSKESSKKKLSISVSYGKKISDGISLGSEEQRLGNPIDFYSRDEFSLDLSNFLFFQKERQITPERLLATLEERHMKPAQLVRGVLARSYLWSFRSLLPSLVRFIDWVLLALLWIISGEKVKEDIWRRLFDQMRSEKSARSILEKIEFEDVKTMDFFGYKAKRWSVVFYCALNLTIFTFLFQYPIHNLLITAILKNNFTTLCYVVVSFAMTEAGAPRFLKFLMDRTLKLYGNVSFLQLKLWW